MAAKRATKTRSKATAGNGADKPTMQPQHPVAVAFARFSQAVARFAGRPSAFVGAVTLIVIWAVSGPLFGFSDTWQLVINTTTTIVTFLMVFLIQNTQNRDTMALQVKLSELIIVIKGASNKVATAEDLSEEELEKLHRHYCDAAEHALTTLENKRSVVSKTH